jgi:hypothetical protein
MNRYMHTQAAPATTWNINHGLGAKPSIDVFYDNNGIINKAFPLSIVHVDDNNVTITWSVARAGYATLIA